jgi:protein required for attachment to host cells
MHRTCIAVVDATRARLFTFDRSAEVEGVREALTERTDLVDPARRQTQSQLFSDTRTNTSRTGGKYFGFDDHRDAHVRELDKQFAHSIAAAIGQMLRESGARRLIVCASPRMLGALRHTDLRPGDVVIDELARDYVKLTPSELRTQLAEVGLLPA